MDAWQANHAGDTQRLHKELVPPVHISRGRESDGGVYSERKHT